MCDLKKKSKGGGQKLSPPHLQFLFYRSTSPVPTAIGRDKDQPFYLTFFYCEFVLQRWFRNSEVQYPPLAGAGCAI